MWFECAKRAECLGERWRKCAVVAAVELGLVLAKALDDSETQDEKELKMLFATDSVAGFEGSAMLSSLAAVVRDYRVKIVETVNERMADVSKLTFFVNEEACASYQPSPDEIEMLF